MRVGQITIIVLLFLLFYNVNKKIDKVLERLDRIGGNKLCKSKNIKIL